MLLNITHYVENPEYYTQNHKIFQEKYNRPILCYIVSSYDMELHL